MSAEDKEDQPPEQRVNSLRMMGRLLTFILPYWPWACGALLLHFIVSALSFVPPLIVGRTTGDIQLQKYDNLLLYAALVVAAALVSWGLSFLRAWLHTHATGHAMWDMRACVFDTLQRLSIGYHERESSGQIISRAIEDLRHVEGFYRMVVFMIVDIGFAYTIATVVMFYKCPQLAGWAISTLPIAAGVTIYFVGRVRQPFVEARQQHGAMTTVLQENLSGVRVVRAFAQEKPQVDKFEHESYDIIPKTMKGVRLATLHGALVWFLVIVALCLTFIMGARMVESNPVDKTIETVTTFLFVQQMIAFRLRRLGRMVAHLQRAVAGGDRVFEVLDMIPEVREKRHADKMPPGPGRVEFQHVHFAYEQGKEALSDIDLTVKPGQMVALVGATGSGKSSVVSLLPRFYDVTSGRILIDGVDVCDVRLRSLRRNIGLVFQESFLFSASVADNIAYGNPKADFEAVTEAACQAQADEFILELPDGYDTVIGERGVTLSGGQKQRLTIARALLPNPRILILDDSTSSVDPKTEREIHETMMQAAQNRTTFVIAHRLSTVRQADLIVVLDEGRIAETGTHDELLARDGLYKQIYDVQFSDDEQRLVRNGFIKPKAPPADDLNERHEEGRH